MKVNNRKTIRHLSFRALLAARRRNIIAAMAIALTSVLFTAIFTMSLSIVATYETALFKQAGGCSHGSFKEVSVEQMEAIKDHKLIKASGQRIIIGSIEIGRFRTIAGEVSFMDENCTKWSYATPTEGRMPEKENEIAMDKMAIGKLGGEAVIGSEIEVPFRILGTKNQDIEITQKFTLVGFWEFDEAMPVHYINVSEAYVNKLSAELKNQNAGEFRRDLNVMLSSSSNIEEKLIKVDKDLGYDWTTRDEENSVRIGVNWGYVKAQMSNSIGAGAYISIGALALLIAFTGYLIIYNIFQISVANDIRFFGLLKTIGVTPRQIKRIIRYQALALCVVGIPVGLLLGYFLGCLLVPIEMEMASFSASSITMSTSPFIFIFATAFSLATVWISSAKPGKMAGKVSPVEATKYTEAELTKAKEHRFRGAKVHQMALANLGRSKRKTVLVMISLSLAVVLLNVLVAFVRGFDMDKFCSYFSNSDFLVGDYAYFNHHGSADENASAELEYIKTLFDTDLSGSAYESGGYVLDNMDEKRWKAEKSFFYSEEEVARAWENTEKKDGLAEECAVLEGMDPELFEKLKVYEGDISSLLDKNAHNIAVQVDVDDYGNVYNMDLCPKIGDKIKLSYVEGYEFYDKNTGAIIDENSEVSNPDDVAVRNIGEHDVEYTVTALVIVPNPLSLRYSNGGFAYLLPYENLKTDSGIEPDEKYYAFDIKDPELNEEAEAFLASFTSRDSSTLKYESKESVKKDFYDLQNIFTVIGGALCAILGLIGALNFINSVMTGIISRKHEFAVLQAVGMTGKQLKRMLIMEGLLYTVGSGVISLALSLAIMPLTGSLLEGMFWFYTSRFIIWPVLMMIPVFAILGYLVPAALYRQLKRESVVERLSDT